MVELIQLMGSGKTRELLLGNMCIVRQMIKKLDECSRQSWKD